MSIKETHYFPCIGFTWVGKVWTSCGLDIRFHFQLGNATILPHLNQTKYLSTWIIKWPSVLNIILARFFILTESFFQLAVNAEHRQNLSELVKNIKPVQTSYFLAKILSKDLISYIRSYSSAQRVMRTTSCRS